MRLNTFTELQGEKKKKKKKEEEEKKKRWGKQIEETVEKKRAARLSNYGRETALFGDSSYFTDPLDSLFLSSLFFFSFFFSLNDIAGNFLANNFNKAERRENSATAAKFVESSRGKPINSVLAHALRKYFISARSAGQRVPCIFRPTRKQLSRMRIGVLIEIACLWHETRSRGMNAHLLADVVHPLRTPFSFLPFIFPASLQCNSCLTSVLFINYL